KIRQKITNLKGEKFVWYIYDPKSDKSIYSFDIDREDPNNFVEFYKSYDEEGYESFCIFHMNPNDIKLMTQDSLVQVVKHKIAKLYPLYRL
ncbi:hypothetical protein, partial [Salmonella enterica]